MLQGTALARRRGTYDIVALSEGSRSIKGGDWAMADFCKGNNAA